MKFFFFGLLVAASALANDLQDRHENDGSFDENKEHQTSRASSLYLNDKTRPFQVNGSSLPDVGFDIGESYAGTLPLDHTGKELFFWFVPSTNPAGTKDITIWLNGGPGCSSLLGFFQENGPATWKPGTFRPVRNRFAWHTLTNMVWIDQPVGTGFSIGKGNATNEIDVADQFRGFWKNFVDLFGFHGSKLYLTGESYAGQYVPYIADGMLNQTDKKYFNVNGILIYDPVIGEDAARTIPAASFMDANPNVFTCPESQKARIRQQSKECGFDNIIQKGSQFPPKGPLPPFSKVTPKCDTYNAVYDCLGGLNPCFNAYQVEQICPTPWDVLADSFPKDEGFEPPFNEPYFNRVDVKKQIHVPLDLKWSACDESRFVFGPRDLDKSPPSAVGNGPLKRVTEKTNNTIIGHGELDFLLFSQGTLLTLQNMTWHGKQGFSEPPTKPFNVPKTSYNSQVGGGLYGAWTADRGLTFVTVHLAGHELPQWTPSAAYCHLQLLLGLIDDLSSGCTKPPKLSS